MNLTDGDTSTTMFESAARAGDVPALVELAKQGDDEAFGILVDEYKGKIYKYVSRMLHDPTEAEDVAQEVFIRAYENLMGFRGAASFQTWLYRIASNLAIDAARARNRRDVGTFSLDRPMATDDGQLERELPTRERGPAGQATPVLGGTGDKEARSSRRSSRPRGPSCEVPFPSRNWAFPQSMIVKHARTGSQKICSCLISFQIIPECSKLWCKRPQYPAGRTPHNATLVSHKLHPATLFYVI